LIHHAAASCIKSHLYEKETCNRKTACSGGSGPNRRGGHRSQAAAGGGGAGGRGAATRSNFVQSSRGFVSVLDFGLSFPSEKIMVLIFFHFFLFFSHPYAGLSFSTPRRLKHPKWTSIYENLEI
jgi:hypothetical protein